MTGYDLSRSFFDWCFENPDKVRPTHIALYFFAIEHCNRLGWKQKFGLPTEMTKDAIGVNSYNTYINAFNDLVEWGFFKLIEKSRNQYSSNIIALSSALSKNDKALDKATLKHMTKQRQSTGESIYSINKPITNTNHKPRTEKVHTPAPEEGNFSEEDRNKFNEFQKWFNSNCENLLKMKKQMTIAEFVKLRKKYSSKEVGAIMRTMENKWEKCKKNQSVYLTAIDWLRIQNKD